MKRNSYKRFIIIWLLSGAFCVFLMVIIGGITRLTGSGLSIVKWDLVHGILPPLTNAEWEVSFNEYKQYPEYKLVNQGMQIDEYKSIFFWEYLHRLLGRFLGILFIVPFVFFLFKGAFDNKTFKRISLIFLLGVLQGLMGWLMVKSGLVDVPHVSHYRLAAHLVLALLIITAIVYAIYGLREKPITKSLSGQAPVYEKILLLIPLLLFVQIVYGAFVAGLKAGYFYNTFPLMGNQFIPTEFLALEPFVKNFFENAVAIQFIHRWLPFVILGLICILFYESDKKSGIRFYVKLLLWAVGVQIVFGVLTLLTTVDPVLGVIHQALAIVVFLLSMILVFEYKRLPKF